jgi:hypothetical protein
MLITFDSELRLRQNLCHWKANSKSTTLYFMKIFQFQRFGGQIEQAVTSVRSSLQLVRTDPIRKLVCSSSGRTRVLFSLRKWRPQLVRSWSGRNTVHSLINRLKRVFQPIFPIFLLFSAIFSLLSHRVYTQTLGNDLREPPNTFLTPESRF